MHAIFLLLYSAVYVELAFSCQVTKTDGLIGRWKSFIGAEVSYTLIASCVLHHLRDMCKQGLTYKVDMCVFVCTFKLSVTYWLLDVHIPSLNMSTI